MAHTSNEDNNKKHQLNSAAFGTNSEAQSAYDADDFLFNAVPFGEYPEVTAEAIRNKSTAATKDRLE